jgi:hypothetical protein
MRDSHESQGCDSNWRMAGLLLAVLVIVALPYVVTLNTRGTQQAADG